MLGDSDLPVKKHHRIVDVFAFQDDHFQVQAKFLLQPPPERFNNRVVDALEDSVVSINDNVGIYVRCKYTPSRFY